MAPPHSDDLASLRATVATLHADLERLKRRRRPPRRLLPLLLAALLVALVPLATLAASPFTDLTGGPHDGNIDAIAAVGITKGCDPTHYCPTGNVTREEMASFLARTAGLGGNPPVANAKTAQSAQTAQTAQTVPDGSVTVAKLSPQGSLAGQVLTATSNGVVWQSTPAAPVGRRIVSGAVAPDGTKAIGSNRYTVTRNAGTNTYILTFPNGTFSPRTANLICVFSLLGAPATVVGAANPGINSAGGTSQTVTLSDPRIFSFLCSEEELP